MCSRILCNYVECDAEHKPNRKMHNKSVRKNKRSHNSEKVNDEFRCSGKEIQTKQHFLDIFFFLVFDGNSAEREKRSQEPSCNTYEQSVCVACVNALCCCDATRSMATCVCMFAARCIVYPAIASQ